MLRKIHHSLFLLTKWSYLLPKLPNKANKMLEKAQNLRNYCPIVPEKSKESILLKRILEEFTTFSSWPNTIFHSRERSIDTTRQQSNSSLTLAKWSSFHLCRALVEKKKRKYSNNKILRQHLLFIKYCIQIISWLVLNQFIDALLFVFAL